MIPTTTGAAAAVSLVLPELKGKLNGLAIRVPTPNVSLVDLVATIEKDGMTVSDINDVLKNASKEELSGIMEFCEAPLVSTDFNGSTVSSIVDSGGTMVVENMIKVIAWYDNEAGYAARMVDLAVMIGMQL
jgi:glyceraldehyde 3-phosphate dehydrogenase